VRRTGIDLTPTGCHVVDAEFSRRRSGGEGAVYRVHRFASLDDVDDSLALTAGLKALLHNGSFPRRACVNLWRLRSSHQYRRLPTATDPQLRIAAHEYGASVLGMRAEDVTVSTVVGAADQDGPYSRKTEVSFFAASTRDIRDLLKPILDAGFSVDAVTTPCGALWAQARLRRPSLPGEPHAYVAVGSTQSAFGIFADGLLLYGRDLDWGFAADGRSVLDRESIASRLALELRRSFLYVKQFWEPDVSQVVLCGEMPEIRSLTGPLIDRLNVEVETLDTLDGIDPETVPAGFADRVSPFRLASAIAAEPPPANLRPVTVGGWSRWSLRVSAVGTAAAIAIAAFLYAQADVRRTSAERELERLSRRNALMAPRPEGGAGASLARAFEAIEVAASDTVSLAAIRAIPDQQGWTLAVDARAPGEDEFTRRRRAERFSEHLVRAGVFDRPPATRVTPQPSGLELALTIQLPR
jgi:hypothetical protein